MKTAIYIEDGVVQLVLTPQNEFEKNVLGSFEDKSTATQVMAGSFYNCGGGWVRHRDADRSLIIRTVKVEPVNGNSGPV